VLLIAVAVGLCALSIVPDTALGDNGVFVRALGLSAVVYLGRFRIHRADVPPRAAIALFAVVLLLTLPFAYWYVDLATGTRSAPPAKWLGDPLAVFGVPCVSFMVFDTRRTPAGWKGYTIRTVAELLVVFPVWFVAWAWAEVWIGWIEPQL
jgi:hypothetical protein